MKKILLALVLIVGFGLAGCQTEQVKTNETKNNIKEGTNVYVDNNGKAVVKKVQIDKSKTTDNITANVDECCGLKKREFKFADMDFKLAWSNKANGVCTMEFTPGNEVVEKYYNLFTIECAEHPSLTPDIALASTVQNIRDSQRENEMIQYKVFTNDKENMGMIDFVMPVDKENSIIEWNVFMFKPLEDVMEGKKGVIRYGFGNRTYDSDGTNLDFMKKLGETRAKYLVEIGKFDVTNLFK